METINSASSIRAPWNKGKLVGQKAPFKLKEIWAIRVRLQIASRCRELALFYLAVDGRFLVPEQNPGVTTPVYPPIRSTR